MNPRYLLDTHVILRWLSDSTRLSRAQARTLSDVVRRGNIVAISALTLLEVAMLFARDRLRMKPTMNDWFGGLEANRTVLILPLTIDIAKQAAALGNTLRDPLDCVIVATARVHNLPLLTSDQRILEANVVSAID